jgi:hypothetical protein
MQGANIRLGQIYDQICEKIYPQIENKEYGVLYYAIHTILSINKEQESNKEQFDWLCKEFDIKKDYNYYQDDYKIYENIVTNPKDRFRFQLQRIFNQQEEEDKEEIMKKWIILVACLLAGTYACIKFLEQNRAQEPGRRPRRDNATPPGTDDFAPVVPQQSIMAALCLVVPASVTSDLIEVSQINADKIKKLIDKASYLLCTKIDDAELLNLEFTDENILNIGENREVFISIPNTQEMIGKTFPHILKRNLPSSSQGKVISLAPLKNLSGLEQFYCV